MRSRESQITNLQKLLDDERAKVAQLSREKAALIQIQSAMSIDLDQLVTDRAQMEHVCLKDFLQIVLFLVDFVK